MWIRYGLEIEKAYPRQARLWELCEWWGSSASSEWSATLLVFKVWSIPCIRSYIILILIIIMIRPGTSLGWSFSSCSSLFSSSPASFSTLSRTDLVLRDGERKPSLGRMKKSYFQIDSWKAQVFYIGFQGFHGLHMVGLDDPHFSWLPPTTWGVSANISRLSHLPRALYQQMQTHSIPNHIHPLYNWPDCSKSSTCSCLQTMMGQLFCGLCALCGLFLLNIPSYIIVSRWRI